MLADGSVLVLWLDPIVFGSMAKFLLFLMVLNLGPNAGNILPAFGPAILLHARLVTRNRPSWEGMDQNASLE